MKQYFSSMRHLAALLFFSFAVQLALAQPGWEKEGELEDVEIEIVKERQITLPKANRNFEKVPPRPAEQVKTGLQYDFRPFSFQTAQINPAIRPLKLKQESGSKTYGGYLSGGYGNYASPYLEGFINSRKDKNKLLGAHAYLNSSDRGPVDGKNSGSGLAGVALYGKTFSEYVTLSGDVSFENRSTHFYGYPEGLDVDAEDIKQAYNQFKLGGSIANTRNTKFTYSLGAAFNYLTDRYEAKESEVDVDFNSTYKINDNSGVGIKAGYAIISRSDVGIDAKARSWFFVNPRYEFYPVENLKLSAGVVAAFENDSIDKKDVHAYPDLHASYPLSPSVEATASLTGGIEKVSLQTLSNENIWIGPSVPIFHTNKLYDLQAGIRTKIGNKVSVNGGATVAALKNWYFFVNDPTDQSRFDPEYDTEATLRTNLYASLGFTQTEAARILVRGDVFGYSRKDDRVAWHRPTYKLTGEASFNVVEKILLDFKAIAQGGMKAPEVVGTEVRSITLDPAFDVNARAEYLFSDTFSFFVQLNNIANTNYPIYYRYPARGFQALGGLTWTF